MCCSEYRNSFHEYASGVLSELECHVIARHLKTCDKCRREVEEIKEMKSFLKPAFQENMMLPMDLKSGIMTSINLKRYKKAYENTLGELANWGMSLVAAGLILLFINVAPTDNIMHVQNEWDNTKVNITQKIYQPFSSINEGLDKFTKRISDLDGITGRIEREKEGGN
ncbi:MAG: anti-sigma factor family protein [Clostridia bacterium]